MSKTILIADDHPLILNGTKNFLESKGYEIVETARDGIEAYHKILKYKPDFSILDFDMPKLNGLEIAATLKKHKNKTKIVILTLYKHSTILDEIGKTIEGYVTKDSGLEELEQCLLCLLEDMTYNSKNLIENIYLKNNATEEQKIKIKITSTEKKILKYIYDKFTSAEIAEMLFISKRTVEKHRSNIYKKLNLDSKNQNALLIWLKNHHEVLFLD